MKRLIVLMILAALHVWTIEAVYGQDQNQPSKTASATAQYQCPNHPEITASWPAKCPKCGANLVRRKTSSQMMSGGSNAENMRRKIMMNTRINVFDPEAILGARKPLKLTNEQVNQLKTISMAARQGAMRVLNAKQRRQLNTLKKLPNYPSTMAQMHRQMMQKLSSSANMMMGKMTQQMKNQDPKSTTDPISKTSDPPPGGRINSGTLEFGDGMSQSLLRDNLRDRLRDKYRDEYRDRYRDQYRDRVRDNLRNNFGGMERYGDDEGFGNNEGFDNNEGFGDEGFGNNEGFDNDERFGGEGFGNNEGFDNGEGFGDEGFGNNEGFDNDEGFGDEGFGDNEGFDNSEGFGGEERRK